MSTLARPDQIICLLLDNGHKPPHREDVPTKHNTKFISPTRTKRSPPTTVLEGLILLYVPKRDPEGGWMGHTAACSLLPHYRVTHRPGPGTSPSADACADTASATLLTTSQSPHRASGENFKHHVTGAGGSVAYGHTHLGGGRQEGRPVSRIRYPTLLYTCIALRVLQIYPNGLAMHLTSLATSSLLLRMFRFKLLSIMFKFKLKCIQLLSENN